MPNILQLITKKDLIDFSQNLSVARNYLGDRLFPDIKTQNLQAEFYRLSDPLQIPKMAKVHGFDTEASIGSRPTFERVAIEKMLIKEKINTSEQIELLKQNGVVATSLISYVYDDMGRLAESVKTRTEVMKMELLQTGKIKVKENNLDITIDYNVPAGNKKAYTWSDAAHDVLADIKEMVDIAKSKGQTVNKVITSTKIANNLAKNTAIQKAVLGTAGVGVFMTLTQINVLMQSAFGFTIETNDELYTYETAAGVLTSKRYLEDTKFIMVATLANGTAGSGLWGVTPEELAQGIYSAKSASQFITIAQWGTPDPVAVWTKASGVFVPAMPNSNGLVIGTITIA